MCFRVLLPIVTVRLILSTVLVLHLHKSLTRVHAGISGYFTETVLQGDKAYLPCNITPPTSANDNISLILWYKNPSEVPIYTIDSRPDFPGGLQQHFVNKKWKGRIDFDLTSNPAVLKMNNAMFSDDGDYRCRVDFQHSRTKIFQISLSVIVPPTAPIITDAHGRNLQGRIGPYNEDSILRLLCSSYDGNPPPELSWWREGEVIKQDSITRKGGVVQNELIIQKLARNDLHARFQCQASNNNRTASARRRITLELNLKPLDVRITSPRTPLSANKLVKLSCQTSGSRPPAVITWWKGAKKMTKTESYPSSEENNISNSVLTIVPSSHDNGKFLSCRADNPNIPDSAMEDGWKLQVHYIPEVTLKIDSKSGNDETYEGRDVFFDCNIRSNPKFHDVEWYFNDRILKNGLHPGVVISTLSLIIHKVKNTNRGKYVCMAKNSEGSGWSNAIYLSVKHSPVCKKSIATKYWLSIEERVSVLCQVDANPPEVKFHWSFNNTIDHSGSITFSVDGTKSVAHYTARDFNDYGQLMCWADNSVGIQNDPCIFDIMYAGLPDPPKNCTIMNQTSSLLEVACLPGYSGGLNQTFIMEVYDDSSNRLRANVTSDDEPRFVANNLPSGSSFFVVVYASNSKGISVKLTVVGYTMKGRFYGDGSKFGFVITPMVWILTGVVVFCIFLAVLILIFVRNRKRPTRKVAEDAQTQPRNQKTEVCLSNQTNYYSDEKNPDLIPYISSVSDEECKLYYSVPLTHLNSPAKRQRRNLNGGAHSRKQSQQSGNSEDDISFRNTEEESQFPDIRAQRVHRPEIESWKSSHSSSNSRFGSISRLRFRMSELALDNEEDDNQPTANTPLMDTTSHSESTV